MNGKSKVMALVPAMLLGIGIAFPTFAQDTNGSPPVSGSTSMHQAGEDTKGAAKNAYDGTATALDDTKITTAIKTDLAAGKDIKSNDIHVTTTAGIVTLHGNVPNESTAARAGMIARNASGVRGVTNDLQVSPPSVQD